MITVVTGASKGIGRAIAERFIREGSHLALCARHAGDLQTTRMELQALQPESCILTVACDLSVAEGVQAFADAIRETFGVPDVLVNNAGRFLPGELHREEESTLEAMLNTNLYSAYRLTRALLPGMMERGAGHIINISSVAGLKAYPHGGSYSISKYALEGFTHNLREEMKPFGIKVTGINPGATWSDSWSGSGVDPNRIMEAADVAELVWCATRLSNQATLEQVVMRPQLGDL